MAEQPFSVDAFAGLNVMDDPEELGASQAVALSNVDFSQPGRIRTRDGWALFSTSATASAMTGLAYYKAADGTEFIIAGDSTTLYPFNLATGVVGTTQALVIAGGNASFARFGAPNTARLYVGAGTNFYEFDNGSWTSRTRPAGLGRVDYVAVTANDNRLAVASNTVADASGSPTADDFVWFSDAGAPTTFGASNYVGLWPGDGEPITGLCRSRDRLFAFKQSKFAVFTNTSTDSAGNPIFNYYGVDAGQGANAGALVAGDDGVFFANNSGVYVTNGQAPVYLSRPLEPWIRAGSFSGLPSLSMANLTLAYFARVLYVTDRTNQTTLVYDTVRQTWSVWSVGATACVAVPATSSRSGFYFGDTGTKKVAKVSSASTADNGAAISWSWKSGMYSPAGDAARVAVTQESKLVGSGTVTLKVATLDASSSSSGSLDTGSAVTLGTSPAVAEGWQQIDREGSWFQHELSGSGQASVSRLVHYVSFVKPAGAA